MSARAHLDEARLCTTEARCTLCDRSEWSAYWATMTGDLHVCRDCAVTILPRLIADATWHRAARVTDAGPIWESCRAEYWRAVALVRDRDAR